MNLAIDWVSQGATVHNYQMKDVQGTVQVSTTVKKSMCMFWIEATGEEYILYSSLRLAHIGEVALSYSSS